MQHNACKQNLPAAGHNLVESLLDLPCCAELKTSAKFEAMNWNGMDCNEFSWAPMVAWTLPVCTAMDEHLARWLLLP